MTGQRRGCRVCDGRGCLMAVRVTRRGHRVLRIADACPVCTRLFERQWRVAREMMATEAAELGRAVARNGGAA